ncbi:hypothetical protein [Prescottella sp. R16]|uniref:hypothetical protein n=1 Tax=Prescottella sp. R16 TaxID=3064529 RepID=UPI00272E500C|nr:hypothetical protein [Prescottella sp. R16]
MVLPIPHGRRAGVVLALVGAAVVLGAPTAGADPAGPSIPRGGLAAVHDVLGLQDPGFWNPDVRGTRVSCLRSGPGKRCTA